MEHTKRQIEIIEAATKLIGEKGIQNLTTKKLAEDVGFSEPALYRHFKNKTQILTSVLLFYKDQLKKGLNSILKSDHNSLDKISAIIDFQFDHFTKYPAVIMVIFAETSFQYNSELSKVVSTIMAQKRTLMISILESGQQNGDIRKDISAGQLCTMVMGGMRFTVLRWRLEDFSFNLKLEGNELINTYKLLLKRN